MAHLPASKARQGFADAINRAAYGKERVVVRRHGKEIAVSRNSPERMTFTVSGKAPTASPIYDSRQGIDRARCEDR
jgi:hypothetical protein